MSVSTDERLAVLGWKGQEYPLRYTFTLVRRMRAAGLNLPELYRACVVDPLVVADRGDEIASMIAWLLRDAGASDVTDEDVWRLSLSDKEFQGNCFSLLVWIVQQHYATSDDAPKQVPPAPKP